MMWFMDLLMILSFPSMAEGQCSPGLKEISGHYLRNHVVDGMVTDSEHLCRMQCHRNDNCMSYNYHSASGACDINDSDHVQDPDGFIERGGYKYVYSENECSGNPCPPNTKCKAHISNPGYHCRCLCNSRKRPCRDFSYFKCQRNYEKVGVVRQRGHFTTQLLQYRVCQGYKNFGLVLNWARFGESVHSLACQCAAIVEKNNWKAFALEYYGICWSGPMADVTPDMKFLREDQYERYACNTTEAECTTKAGYHYIYRLKQDFFQHLKVPCEEDQPIGMKNGDNPSVHITDSDQDKSLNVIEVGLESRVGAWRPNGQNPWLMIDIGIVTRIVRIATQGHPSEQEWVTRYSLSISSQNADTFNSYENGRKFTGNTDSNSIVSNVIDPAIEGVKYIKIHPVGWYNAISMRVEVYRCENEA